MKFLTALFTILCFSIAGLAQSQSNVSQLNKKAKEAYEKYDFSASKELLKEAISIQEKQGGKRNNKEYIESLHLLFINCYKTRQYAESDSLYTQLNYLIKEEYGKESTEYAKLLIEIVKFKLNRQIFNDAEDALKTALNIQAKTLGKESAEYAETLCQLGIYYTYISNLAEAQNVLTKSADIMLAKTGKDDVRYINTQLALGLLFFYSQDFSASEKLLDYVVNECRKYISIPTTPSHNDFLEYYFSAAAGISIICANTGKLDKAIELTNESMQLMKKYYGENHPEYAGLLSNLGSLYFIAKNYDKAEPILIESLEIARNSYGEKHSHYFNILNSLGLLYQHTGKPEKAEPMHVKSLELRKELYGASHPSVALALNNLSNHYSSMGNYPLAEKCVLEAMEITESSLGKNSTDYALELNMLGHIYISQEEYNKAMPTLEEAAEICKNTIGEHTSTYLTILNNLYTAIVNARNAPYEVVENKLLEIIEKRKEIQGSYNIDYTISLNTLARFYDSHGQHAKANELFKQCLAQLESTTWKNDKNSYSILINLGINFGLLDSIPQSLFYFERYFDEVKEAVNQNFAFLSESEREIYWTSINEYIKYIQDHACFYAPQYPSASALVYNCELFSKSLLLNSANQVQQSITNSGDKELISTWEEIKELKDNIEEVKNNIIKIEANATIDKKEENDPVITELKEVLDEMENSARQKEREVTIKSQVYRRQQTDFLMKWENVKNALNEGEVAIELINFNRLNLEDEIKLRYHALLIRPESTYPEVIKLCAEEVLLKVIAESGNDLDKIYPLVWAPIEKHLNGVKRIYLSSTGLLNSIPFAAFKENNTYIGDKYEIHHLLSTKDIIGLKAESDKKETQKTAILFGGADYGLSIGELANEQEFDSKTLRGMLDEIDPSRGQGFDYLPGSKKEVETISKILAEKGWNTNTYTNKVATKNHFKSFSGKNAPNLIHISTHGFYFPVARNEKNKTETPNIYKLSNNPLMRSGLLFSGANHIWTGKTTVENKDDGVLTAYEISNLNFTNTDLVVLSACETGLGDINYSEGVYGLQRAFRLAGAKSMIVSLWKVSDKETTEFMTEFYKQWAAGSNMKKAFDNAQNTLKAKHANKPEKWAGFVLIE